MDVKNNKPPVSAESHVERCVEAVMSEYYLDGDALSDHMSKKEWQSFRDAIVDDMYNAIVRITDHRIRQFSLSHTCGMSCPTQLDKHELGGSD